MPFLLLICISLLWAIPAKAQTSDDLYQKYIQSGSAYRTSYTAYTVAKKEQIQYQTGITQLEAINKTNDILLKRNDWQINYFQYLRAVLAEATNIANYAQTLVYLNLDSEISHLEELIPTLGSANSFSEINSRSKEWESRVAKEVSLIQAAQAQIASAKLAALLKQTEELFGIYQSQITSPTDKQLTTISLITQKITATKTSLDSANKSLNDYKSSYSYSGTFNILRTARENLLDAAKLLKELKGQS